MSMVNGSVVYMIIQVYCMFVTKTGLNLSRE